MLDYASLFKIANLTAMVSWLLLLVAPLLPKLADRVAGYAVPLLFSVAYAGLILAFWGQSEGGFDSLDNVKLLLSSPPVLLAGWLHYLAFDLFVGAWEVRTARAERMPFWLVIPCLPLTFMFGPAGFLLFMALRAATAAKRAAAV